GRGWVPHQCRRGTHADRGRVCRTDGARHRRRGAPLRRRRAPRPAERDRPPARARHRSVKVDFISPPVLRRWTRAANDALGEAGPARRATLGAVMRAVALLYAARREIAGVPRIDAALAGGGPDAWRRIEDACDEADRRARVELFAVRPAF